MRLSAISIVLLVLIACAASGLLTAVALAHSSVSGNPHRDPADHLRTALAELRAARAEILWAGESSQCDAARHSVEDAIDKVNAALAAKN